MIRRLLALLRGPWIADAPADDTSLLDELDGVHGLGECPPLTDTQAANLMRDIASPPFADWEETRAEVEADVEWDNHVDDALNLVSSPWNDGDRAMAAALGIAL